MSSENISSLGDDSAQLGYDSRLSSQRFDSASYQDLGDYGDIDATREGGTFETDSPIHVSGEAVESLNSDGAEAADNGPIFPPPADLEREEGFALREWRRLNAIRIEEKERKEKEMVKQIIGEADEYKAEYYRKWKVRCENSKAANREKEKLSLESREKFHAEVSKAYWKAIAELIPKEVLTIEKKGKKKPSVVVIQGPKPGKLTDLSRMRQILVKLKHTPPPHMMPPPPPKPEKDAKTQPDSPASNRPSVAE